MLTVYTENPIHVAYIPLMQVHSQLVEMEQQNQHEQEPPVVTHPPS